MRSERIASCDIIETVAGVGSLQAFAAAIVAARLRDKLRGPGLFTVFAPMDGAFERIAEHVLQGWLWPESRAGLRDLLTYHLLPGRMPAARIIESSSVRTVRGTSLTIRYAAGRMHVNNAGVVQADIECSNGLIHTIDTVLIPR